MSIEIKKELFSEGQKQTLTVSVQALAEALQKISLAMLEDYVKKNSLFELKYFKNAKSIQEVLHHAFLDGKLTSLAADSAAPLTSFCEYQLANYDGEEKEKEKFLQFISQVKPVFHCIDRGISFDRSKMDLPSFEEYIKNNPINLPEKTILNISESLDDYQIELIHEVTQELIQHFSLDEFGVLHMENALFHVQYYLNNKLLPRKVQKKLKKFAFRYFLQMLRDSFYYLDLKKVDRIINDLLRDFCYEVDCMYLFEEYMGKEKNYPRKIFASYKAYKLFDDVAKKITSRRWICFLFRKMHEKDSLIYVKDTEFRNWFNAQEYAVQLENHTDTYIDSYSEVRISTMELLYKCYGLS
ncbi:hypothetical protein NMK71_04725 [Weeksellaceae bacterium KMM 9713]|uniref:Uncharacterized protein n=1 Tax=Profundicola chukchiensis TaxID=2961959 RepID=A0A9X4MXB5_9FLAO|nr:hypothetical protein [Profundicola chukchiensis]MDG4945709.1 hypothetical protein [Profundicola chukchiensis]